MAVAVTPLSMDVFICAFCLTKNPDGEIVCRVCGLSRYAVPSLLYLRAGLDASLRVSTEIAVGEHAFDLAHVGGESLLFLTEAPEATIKKAAALGLNVGKAILLKPSALPRKDVDLAGGAIEWLRSGRSARRRAGWETYSHNVAAGLHVSNGTFLSRDAVKSLGARSDVVRAGTSAGVVMYELRSGAPNDAGIAFEAAKVTAAVQKVVNETPPDTPNTPPAKPAKPDNPDVPQAPEPEARYLEVDGEMNVRITDTVRLNVRLAAKAPTGGLIELVKLLIPSAGLAVTVNIDGGDGLKALDDTYGMLIVNPGIDTPWLLFRFMPLRAGRHPINVRLFTGATLSATLRFEVLVDEEQRAVTPGRKPVILRDRGPDEVSLDIHYEKSQAKYRYKWIDCSFSQVPERWSEQLTGTPDAVIENVVSELSRVARGTITFTEATLPAYLRTRGTSLWDALITDKMKQDFSDRRAEAKTLTLHTDADPMLWEVLYPGEEPDRGFLIEQLFVTRWCSGSVAATTLKAGRSLIVIPESDAPRNARAEAEAIADLLSTRGEVQYVERLEPLLERLGEPFDILHFACHNTFTSAGSKIRFPDGLFDAQFLKKPLVSSPLVFINACRSDGVAETYTGLTNWAMEFIRMGAGAFIGSLWEVTDDTAPEFAKIFYTQLLAHKPIASAMNAARETVKGRIDPTWLAYTLYADPTAVLV